MNRARVAAEELTRSTSAAAHGVLAAAGLAYLPLIAAAALTFACAAADRVSFDDVVLLSPVGAAAGRFAAALAAMAAGYFAVFFAPGLLILRALRWRAATPVGGVVAAFALSQLGMALAWIAAQAVTEGVAGRTCVYLTAASLDAAALLAAVFVRRREGEGPAAGGEVPVSEGPTLRSREVLAPAAAAVLVIAAAWLFMPGKITTEALEGDATEVHGFATSLVERALPEWDLESGAWGFYPTFMYVGYPVFWSIALGGDSEAAVRLPALLFLGMLLVMLAELAGRKSVGTADGDLRGTAARGGGALGVLLPLAFVAYLSVQVGAYYCGYHPVHGDLGSSPLEEWMVTALAVCAIVLLRDGAPALAVIPAFLSVLTFPSGLMFVALVGVAGVMSARGAQRREVIRWGLLLAAVLAVYAVSLVVQTKANGTFDAMIGEWHRKYFARRASFGAEEPARMAAAVGWYALLAGGVPVLGYLLAPRWDRVAKWLALLGVAWTLFFVLSPGKNVHYFLPSALLPAAVLLRCTSSRWVPAAVAASALTCIALCRPSSPEIYTADRQFGRRTLFLTNSYQEAVRWSHVIYNLVEYGPHWDPGKSWSIGHHTWVLYADRGFDVDGDYQFFVSDGPAPRPELTEITRLPLEGGKSAVLWSREGRATLRPWKDRTFATKRELSRFDFDMGK
ncbi:MAG: hypothetical protein ACT4PE_01550 [Candidatus Eiseniibacteriota bacterium]